MFFFFFTDVNQPENVLLEVIVPPVALTHFNTDIIRIVTPLFVPYNNLNIHS